MIVRQQHVIARKDATVTTSTLHARTRLASLASDEETMVSRHDPEGTYLEATGAVRRLLGLEPEEVVGTSAYAYFHPDDLLAIQESHRVIIETNSTYSVTYRIRHASGAWTRVRTVSWTQRDADGQPVDIIGLTVPQELLPDQRAEELEAVSFEDALAVLLD